MNSKIFAEFNALQISVASGESGPIQQDSDGVLRVRSAGPSPGSGAIQRLDATGDDNTDTIVKASPGDLVDLTAHNPAASTIDLFLHIFDRVDAPVDAVSVPIWISPPVPPGETIAWQWGDSGLPMAVGIVVAPSDTRLVYGLPGAAEKMNIAGRFR